MKIIVHDRFKDPVIIEATSLIVLDDYDNAIMGALWHQPGHIQVAHTEDGDFETLMQLLGHKRKTVVDEYKGQPVCQTQPIMRRSKPQ